MANSLPLHEKRVAFCGKLGGVSHREARRLVRNCGGIPVDLQDEQIELVVLGAEELPIAGQQDLLDDRLRSLVRTGKLEVISETRLWENLGFVDPDSEVQRLYTPAMIAELLHVSVTEIRKWHRRGLIRPAREVHRLPYFDFQEVSTARRLAEMVEAGASPTVIKRNLERLAEYVPDIERPLAQLSVIVEGKQIFLRNDDAIMEPNGQIRFDFGPTSTANGNLDFEAEVEAEQQEPSHSAIPFPSIEDDRPDNFSDWAYEDLLELACENEDAGHLEFSIEIYRSLLMSHGPRAEVNFQLAELLYRTGNREGACERYYMAIELDEEFVEARANLGCLLAELGQDELAVAAFEGALEFHADFPDVHFHLARTLDRLKKSDEAELHWRMFLKKSPESPWATEARERLKLVPVGQDA